MFIPASELNHGNISQQLAAGLAAIEKGQAAIEFSQTTRIDSSAVACMLAWKRHAQQRGISLKFEHVPDNLNHLIVLYGVSELI